MVAFRLHFIYILESNWNELATILQRPRFYHTPMAIAMNFVSQHLSSGPRCHKNMPPIGLLLLNYRDIIAPCLDYFGVSDPKMRCNYGFKVISPMTYVGIVVLVFTLSLHICYKASLDQRSLHSSYHARRSVSLTNHLGQACRYVGKWPSKSLLLPTCWWQYLTYSSVVSSLTYGNISQACLPKGRQCPMMFIMQALSGAQYKGRLLI